MIVLTLVPIDVRASVGDNVGNSKLEQLVGDPVEDSSDTLFGMLRQLVDGIGIGKFANTPTAEQYANASLVEKVNYLQVRLEQVFQSASNGKAAVAGVLTSNGVSTANDATFETIKANIQTMATNKYEAGKVDGLAMLNTSPSTKEGSAYYSACDTTKTRPGGYYTDSIVTVSGLSSPCVSATISQLLYDPGGSTSTGAYAYNVTVTPYSQACYGSFRLGVSNTLTADGYTATVYCYYYSTYNDPWYPSSIEIGRTEYYYMGLPQFYPATITFRYY